MPDLFVVLFLLVLALGAAVLSASWGIFFALLAIAYLAIRWNSQRGLEDERWKNTRLRLEALEAEVKRLASRTAVFRAEPAGAPEAEPAPEQPKSAAPQPPIATPPPSPKPVIEKPVAPPKPSVPPTPAAPEKIVVPAKPAPPTAKPFQPPVVAPPPPISAAPAQASARMTSQVAAPAGMAAPPKKSAGLEELIGTNWLPKLGVALIVGGLVSLLIYKWADLWPSAKLAVGFLSGAAMLGGGVFLERRERYQLFARSCIGGGWAMIFFTTFAMYHIGATRVLSSPIADLVLMIVVAAAMVLHTLKYRSQLATGFAFLLGYASIALNAVGPDGMNIGVPGLAASVILAAGLVTVVAREGWFELEVLGIVATYLNHWYWLRPIIEPMGGARHPFPEFLTSAVILCLY